MLDILESQKGMVMTQDSHDEKRRKHMAVMDDKRKNKMTSSETTFNDEELIKHLRAGPEIVYRYVSVDHAAADRIEELNAKLAKAVAAMQALKDFDDLPLSAKRPDLFEIRVRRPILAALDEIKGDTE